ncbi:hypothetical protein [Uliginosibacterium sp. H1]|uniref:hypothetical protein n=1 Tax=Uliginosibacterium sp. H1 TaxID=3114757 RepID=UPI002E19C6E3|nr:hypothetical protein [Uliginosibacterium sp. H1]
MGIALETGRDRGSAYEQGLYYMLLLVFFAAVFDPMARVLHMKYVAFGVLCLFALHAWWSGRMGPLFKPGLRFWAVFAVLVPGYGLVLTALRAGQVSLGADSVYLSAGVFLGYCLLLNSAGSVQAAIRALDRVLMLLAGSILVLSVFLVLAFVQIIDLSKPLFAFLLEHGIAFSGIREYADLRLVNLYFYSAPMLVFVAARRWDIYFSAGGRGDLAAAALTSIALFLTGTRACIVLAVLTPAVVWGWRRYGPWWSVFVFGAAGGLLLVLASMMGAFTVMLSSGEYSNAVKLAYLTHYQSIWSDLGTLLFGQGFDAVTWSETFRGMLVGGSRSTELTYLEVVRVYGLIVAVAVCALLVSPVFFWRRMTTPSWRFLPMAWFLFLLLAASNPYIFSSTGMTLFGIVSMAMLHDMVRARKERHAVGEQGAA